MIKESFKRLQKKTPGNRAIAKKAYLSQKLKSPALRCKKLYAAIAGTSVTDVTIVHMIDLLSINSPFEQNRLIVALSMCQCKTYLTHIAKADKARGMEEIRGEWMGLPPRLVHYVYDDATAACGFRQRKEYLLPVETVPHRRSCAKCRSIINEAKLHCDADQQLYGYWRCMCLSCRKLRKPTEAGHD